MKEIITDLIEGDSRKRLSIISDVSTILGVSVATFVAGPFLSEFANIEFILSDFIISILFYFICIYLVASVGFSFIKEAITKSKEKRYHDLASSTILALFISWVAIVCFPYAKYYFGNAFNVSYLLSLPAEKAIISVNNVSVAKEDELLKISVKLNFNVHSKPSDYVAILYAQNKNGIYEIVQYTKGFNSEYEVTISNLGEITIPVKLSDIAIGNPYLLIYRNSDWSLLSGIGTHKGYPDDLTQIPMRETEDLGAYSSKIQLNNALQSTSG